jgi:hypothetical protein
VVVTSSTLIPAWRTILKEWYSVTKKVALGIDIEVDLLISHIPAIETYYSA